jgi:hypothetical protein
MTLSITTLSTVTLNTMTISTAKINIMKDAMTTHNEPFETNAYVVKSVALS